MIYKASAPYRITQEDTHWVIAFKAMASPCEVLVRCSTEDDAEALGSMAFAEVMRIEHKFSRYRDDNIVFALNHGDGRPVDVDEETSHLLSYAGECYRLSDGLFDITSGILRKAWRFEGQEVTPDQKLIASLLRLVGWNKVQFDGTSVTLRPGMEIDFGGVGKEYAVDRVAQMLFDTSGLPVMVNFGGDIRAIDPGSSGTPWKIGIENPDPLAPAIGMIELSHGAVATSGVSYRHCFVKGRRLGHILNPRTGWPVEDPPRSVTVVGDFCTEAGLFTTLAMLHGPGAEEFLKAQELRYHCVR